MENNSTVDPIFLRIDELLTAQGKKQTDLINYLRMARGTYVHWKTQKNKSYMKHLDEIADFFGVPLYYLVKGSSNPEDFTVSQEEYEMVSTYRKLSREKKETIDNILNFLSDPG